MPENPFTNIIRYGFVPRGTASGPQTLTGAVSSNSNTFFAATISQPGVSSSDYRHEVRLVYGLNHAFVRFGRQPVGQAGAGVQRLSPSLIVDGDTFYSPTVSQPGAVSTDYRHHPRIIIGLGLQVIRYGHQPVGSTESRRINGSGRFIPQRKVTKPKPVTKPIGQDETRSKWVKYDNDFLLKF